MTKDLAVAFWNKYWNFIISVLIFCIVLFGLYFKHDSVFTGQSVRDATTSFLVSLLVTFIFRLNAFQLSLESNQDVVSKFQQLLSSTPKIKKTIEHTTEAKKSSNQFYDFFLENIFDEFNKDLLSITQGAYRCNAESELTLTKTILKCCNKSLKAVSFEDESWWNSNEGTLYLTTHKNEIKRDNEKATRIFLTKSTELESLKPTLKKHKELGIDTYLLFTDKDQIADKYKIDFVIYDDFMVRCASKTEFAQVGKNALFTSEATEVKKYLELFDQLLILAKDKAEQNKLPE